MNLNPLTAKGAREYKKAIGNLGESIACHFLEKRGYKIVEKNYLKKWGEVDIVAKKENSWHFIEVKTVSRENSYSVNQPQALVSRATPGLPQDEFRPEDNLHPWKLKRFVRTVETYIAEKGLDEVAWQIDAITVKLWVGEKKAKVRFIENVL